MINAITTSSNRNPGIVPPWLLDPIRILPIDEQGPAARTFGGDTQFVAESVDASPASFADILRSR